MANKNKKNMIEEKKVPVYEFIKEEGDEKVNPFKRKVSKTMEVTETFVPFNVMEYIAKIEKAIKEKEGEIEGLKNMLNAYNKEMELISETLGLNDLEKEFLTREPEKEITEESVKEDLEKNG
jgi:hypothetical protein